MTGSSAMAGPIDVPARRRVLVFGIVSIGLLMSSIDQTIVATALSTIGTELHTTVQWASWTITIYSLGQVLVMPLAGRLSDHYGRKTVFLVAVGLFTVASLGCGLAQNIVELNVLRLIQALGGGALMPSASGVVADHFGRNRDRALGLFAGIFPVGGAIGPIFGGLFVQYWSWRDIFLINVPLGIVLVALTLAFIPNGGRKPAPRFDVPGVALLGTVILGSMLGISELGDNVGFLSVGFILPEAVAAVALVLFVRHLRRTPDPFIPAALLVGRRFGVMNALNFLFGAAVLGFPALVPLYAQYRYAINPLESGTLLTARAIGIICMASVATFALRRTGYRLPMIVGFLIAAGGLFMMLVPPPVGGPYVWLAVAAGVTGLGMGLSTPAANNATLQFAGAHVAVVSGLRGMFRQSGAILSVSIVTAAIAQGSEPTAVMTASFAALAALLVLSTSAIFFVPEHRGAW